MVKCPESSTQLSFQLLFIYIVHTFMSSINYSLPSPLKVGIIGGSIGGLAAATAFYRLGASVKVFEKSPSSFEGRGGSIGFCDIPLWQALRGERMIRRGVQASRGQGAFLYGDLWQFWNAGLPAGTITYNSRIDTLGDDVRNPMIQGETFDLVILADGGWSEMRKKYFSVLPAPDYAGYGVWRFRINAKDVPGFSAFGEYYNKHHFTIILPIAKDDGQDFLMGGTAIAQPESEAKLPDAGSNRQEISPDSMCPDWFLPYYKEKFGNIHNGEIYRVMEVAAQKGKIAPHWQYEFKATQIVQGRLVLVGDAAHMASPRTGAGAHTAVLDAMGLYDAFGSVLTAAPESATKDELIQMALRSYEPEALQRASALYARSRAVSSQVVPPGWLPKSERQPPTNMKEL